MKSKQTIIDPLPENFASIEEAAEFWETHDTTNYPDAFRDVELGAAELRQRHYEVEIEPDLLDLLRERAQIAGISISSVVSSIVRKQLAKAA